MQGGTHEQAASFHLGLTSESPEELLDPMATWAIWGCEAGRARSGDPPAAGPLELRARPPGGADRGGRGPVRCPAN